MNKSPSFFSGTDVGYKYRCLENSPYFKLIPSYAGVTRKQFTDLARAWNGGLQADWVLRSYLTIKMIALATLMLSSAEEADKRNLRISVPYLHYFGLFSCARAFLLMTPDFQWTRDSRLGHAAGVRALVVALRRLDSANAPKYGALLGKLRDQREIYSYNLPSLGLGLVRAEAIPIYEIIVLAQLLCDLCQFNSECLQSALEKHGSKTDRTPSLEELEAGIRYGAEGSFWDDDDHYRLDTHFRKFGNPIALSMMATQGLVEDLFGSWTSDNDDGGDAYNPDEHWGYLFGFE